MSRGAGRVSLPIDVIIPGAGRVKKQSGVFARGERDDLIAMLRLLPKQGHVALVQEIQTGRRSLLEVYAHFTAGKLAQLCGPQDDQPLAPIVEPWLDTALCAEGTRQNRRDAFRVLQGLVRRAPLLRDLPELLQFYRAQCEAAKPRPKARTFNIARTAAQAFVRDTIGKRKALTLAVADVEKLTERGQGRPGLPLADAIAARDELGGQAGRIWWSMCLTGMGPGELWGAWTVEQDRIHIEGTKVVRHGSDGDFGRVRDVPLVDFPVRPELTRDGFTSALRRLSGKRLKRELCARLDRDPTAQEVAAAAKAVGPRSSKITPYQGRKTFARWMEDAGIPRARREVYRGHGKRDIGDVYERYEVSDYLRGDAEKMRTQLGPQKLAIAR